MDNWIVNAQTSEGRESVSSPDPALSIYRTPVYKGIGDDRHLDYYNYEIINSTSDLKLTITVNGAGLNPGYIAPFELNPKSSETIVVRYVDLFQTNVVGKVKVEKSNTNPGTETQDSSYKIPITAPEGYTIKGLENSINNDSEVRNIEILSATDKELTVDNFDIVITNPNRPLRTIYSSIVWLGANKVEGKSDKQLLNSTKYNLTLHKGDRVKLMVKSIPYTLEYNKDSKEVISIQSNPQKRKEKGHYEDDLSNCRKLDEEECHSSCAYDNDYEKCMRNCRRYAKECSKKWVVDGYDYVYQGYYEESKTTTYEKYESPELEYRYKAIEIAGKDLKLENHTKSKIQFAYEWISRISTSGKKDSNGRNDDTNSSPSRNSNFNLNMPNSGYDIKSLSTENKEIQIIKQPEGTIAETFTLNPNESKNLNIYKDSVISFRSTTDKGGSLEEDPSIPSADEQNKKIKELEDKVSDLEKKLKQCQDKCTADTAQCVKDKAAIQAKIDELQGKLNSIEAKLKEAGFGNDTDLSEAVNTAIAKVAELKKKVDTMQSQIDKLTQENTTLKEQLAQANKKVENLNSEITNLRKQLEECQNKCTTDSEQCTKDKAALQEKINTLEKEISDIKEKIVKVIGDTEIPKDLSSAADALLKKVSDLESKVKDLESKVKDLETKLAAKDKENSELQKEKEQLEKDKAQLEKDKQILEDGKKKLEEEKQKLEEAKKILEEKLVNTEKQIENLTKEKEKLEKEKKELEEKTGSTSEEDKAKIKELEDKISEKDNSIKELEDKLEKETKEKEELDKKLNDKDRQTKILEQIIKEKDEQCKKNTQNWIKEKEKWERDRYYWNYYDNRERRDILGRIKELEEENKFLSKKNNELKDKMKDYPNSNNKINTLGNRDIISNLGERPSITGYANSLAKTIFYLGNSIVEDYQGNHLVKSISMSDSKGNIIPIIKNNRTMLPVRYLVESLGMKVSWDQKTGTATFDNSNGNNALRRGLITINSKTLEMRNENGQLIVVDSEPFLRNGRFYASITNLAKAFNGSHGSVTDSTRSTIEWDQKNKRVIINRNVR